MLLLGPRRAPAALLLCSIDGGRRVGRHSVRAGVCGLLDPYRLLHRLLLRARGRSDAAAAIAGVAGGIAELAGNAAGLGATNRCRASRRVLTGACGSETGISRERSATVLTDALLVCLLSRADWPASDDRLKATVTAASHPLPPAAATAAAAASAAAANALTVRLLRGRSSWVTPEGPQIMVLFAGSVGEDLCCCISADEEQPSSAIDSAEGRLQRVVSRAASSAAVPN